MFPIVRKLDDSKTEAVPQAARARKTVSIDGMPWTRGRPRKLAHLSSLSIIAALVAFQASSARADLDQGLIGHWAFEDGSGSVASDASVSAENGTLVGSPTWASGPQSGALDFDGSNYVRIIDDGAGPFDLSTSLSLSAWVNPHGFGGNQKLISKDNIFEFELGHAGSNRYSARLANLRRGRGDTPLVADRWQHLVLTWDGSTVTYYYNGVADGTASYAGPLPSNDRDLGLGARPAGYLDGLLDEVRIYDRALSASEVAELHLSEGGGGGDLLPPTLSLGAPSGELPIGTSAVTLFVRTDEAGSCRFDTTAGTSFDAMVGTMTSNAANEHTAELSGMANHVPLRYYVRCRDAIGNTHQEDYEIRFSLGPADSLIGHWKLDGAVGPIAVDSSAYGHDATVSGSPAGAAGIHGGSWDFDGDLSQQVLRIEDPGTDSDLDLTESLTIMAWVRPEMLAGDLRILSKDMAYEFEIGHSDEGRYSLRLANQLVARGDSSLIFEQWQHIAVTWDGSTVRYYLDGQPDGSSAFAGPIAENDRPLGLASRPNLGRPGGTGIYEGALDEVRLYDRALGDTEIDGIVRSTQPPAPHIALLEPNGQGETFPAVAASDSVLVTWVDRDPDDDAAISLYYSTNPDGDDRQPIVTGLSENSENDSYLWDVSELPPGGYYVHAVIEDGTHPAVTSTSPGSVDIGFEVVIDALPAASDVRAGLPVTFRAHTEPAGYEQYIDWYVNTATRKAGRASEERGRGAEFVTSLDAIGFEINGNPFIWYEICAGNACIQGDFDPFAMTGSYPGDTVILDPEGLVIGGQTTTKSAGTLEKNGELYELIGETVVFIPCCPGFRICCYFVYRRVSDGAIRLVLIGCSDCSGRGGD